ncbi:hypothetical protein E1B28_003239 [Marasmius oreades]|uniref:C2H2-type domain-containing protein n=1 Tax=Marasmius oreades TaxID=181124 RepID=A0A9P7RL53_9AGAR|nr:uncharacterized protein E1B28_003239 [Marasmius oreades]KAG7085694.1 hypothetical protein E1B28_003239 [Marasmius oreades]
MPRKSTASSACREGHQCDECGIVLARSGDMSRHKKIHSENRQEIVHWCPWDGCNFSSLQKSNVETHFNTHTGKKNKHCPECDFSTGDPGSLTRHRKRRHAYVPKPRARLGAVASHNDSSVTTSRASRRHAPYPRARSSSSTSSESSASSLVSDCPAVFVQSKYTSMSLARPEQDSNERMIPGLSDLHSRFFWRPHDVERIARSPSPKLILPAVDTGRHMQENATFQPHEHYYTQTGQMQFPAAPIENWDFASLPDANHCTATLGEQYVPQYLVDEGVPLEFDLELAAAFQQQMLVTGSVDSDSTNINGPFATSYDWPTFLATVDVESPASTSYPDASLASFPSSAVSYSSYSSPYNPGPMTVEDFSSVLAPLAPTSFGSEWELSPH